MKQLPLVIIFSLFSLIGCGEEPQTGLEEYQIYIPNLITAAELEENVFYPQADSDDLIVESMTIYDRLGNLVFNNTQFPINQAKHGWDGTINGQLADPGTYTYAITISDGNVSSTFDGDLTVVL